MVGHEAIPGTHFTLECVIFQALKCCVGPGADERGKGWLSRLQWTSNTKYIVQFARGSLH